MATSSETSTASAPALTFPREIFAALQPRQYLLAHLAPPSKSQTPIRPNGRAPSEFRPLNINTNSLTHCNGSAVVRLGDTAVVCGVRGEILLASNIANPPDIAASSSIEEEDDAEQLSNLGLLVPNVELATGSNPSHIPGQAPSNLAQMLASKLLQQLSTTRVVRARDLGIFHHPAEIEGTGEEQEHELKAYWTLYIDVLYMSLDGAAFDAAWIAVLAALRSTQLPKAWWDTDLEMILCSDAVSDARMLNLRGLPISSSFAVFDDTNQPALTSKQEKGWILADPDRFEEEHCREIVSVVVDITVESPASIRAISKRGGSYVDVEKMGPIIDAAQQHWKECRDALQNAT